METYLVVEVYEFAAYNDHESPEDIRQELQALADSNYEHPHVVLVGRDLTDLGIQDSVIDLLWGEGPDHGDEDARNALAHALRGDVTFARQLVG